MTLEGKKAPAFTLEASAPAKGDAVPTKVRLADLAGKWVVVYFYPKDATPGCTTEALQFRDLAAEFAARGAVVLGVSKDSVASHCKFRDKHSLGFALLSDPDGAMMAKYGAWGEKVMYGKKVTGTIRSTVLIAPDGKVARHWTKVKADGHAAEVLAALDALRRAGSGG
jgi:peroxiredoxin Q/BCP